MGFEGASAAASGTQFHEALVCPICPKLFVESLWSLIAHINAVHRDSPLVLDYHSLQRLKKIVPKSAVCVIRPAFTANGNRSDFLNFFAADETIGNSMTSELKESEASLRQRTFQEESESKSISPEPVSLDLSISRKSTFRSHLNRVHRELTPVKMETIIKAAARGGDSNEINNGGFEMSTFEENNNFAKTSTEKLAETVEKVIIKQEIFDS
uniref:C2H2-type domain-containing protein n=1 Tax=Panagrolaimus sp. PS1159 TaxID=55785 RepID=A0AC35F5B5_9BILA